MSVLFLQKPTGRLWDIPTQPKRPKSNLMLGRASTSEASDRIEWYDGLFTY